MKRGTAGVVMLAVLSVATLAVVGCKPKAPPEAELPAPAPVPHETVDVVSPGEQTELGDEVAPEGAADTAAPTRAGLSEGTQGPGDRRDPFERFDADEDGKLTKAELPEKAAKALMAADANGDEAITRDEFQKGRENGTLRPPEGTGPGEGSGPGE